MAWAAINTRTQQRLLVQMDEFTSAQDKQRASTMWDIIDQTLNEEISSKQTVHIFVATHDPTTLRRWNGQQTGRRLNHPLHNHTLWFHRNDPKSKLSTPAVLLPFRHYAFNHNQPLPATKEHFVDSNHGFITEILEDTSSLPSVQENMWQFFQQLSKIHQLEELGENVTIADENSQNGFKIARVSEEGGLDMGPRKLVTLGKEKIEPISVTKSSISIVKGSSGSGKSTLFKHLIDKKKTNISIGWIPQDPGRAFPSQMEVVEAMRLNRAGLNEKTQKRVNEYFTKVNFWNQEVGSLSEGQRQRVSIIRELLRLDETHGGSVLLLDEPFGSLDPENHINWMNRLLIWLRKNDQKRAMVMISHTQEIEFGLFVAKKIDAAQLEKNRQYEKNAFLWSIQIE